MNIFLDTNICICIYLIKKNPSQVTHRLRQHHPSEIGISCVTVAELRYGASNSASPQRNHQVLDAFLQPFHIDVFCEEAARRYGDLQAALKRAGQPIGMMDTLIAAHALARKVVLVSNNLREFARVPDLRCDNWVETR